MVIGGLRETTGPEDIGGGREGSPAGFFAPRGPCQSLPGSLSLAQEVLQTSSMASGNMQFASHRLQNMLQMVLLIGGLAGVLALPAWLLAATGGIVWTLLLVVLSAGLVGTVPARLVLARSGAGLIHPGQAPELYRLLAQIYRRAGLRAQPALYYVPSPRLNAFAVGDRNDGGIAITEGLLRHLNLRQLAGVLAHEVSHLAHNDTRVMAMAASMTQLTAVGATGVQILLVLSLPWAAGSDLLVYWALLLILAAAPTASTLLQLALSRNREFTADLEAAALTGDPRGLAAALKALETHGGDWLEALFGNRGPEIEWLRTHPPTGERIRRLLSIDAGRRDAVIDSLSPQASVRPPASDALQPLPWRGWLWR